MDWIRQQIETVDVETKLIFGVCTLMVLITIAVYFISKVRQSVFEEPEDQWASLEQMRASGTLREYEYQHLRKTMAAKKAAEYKALADGGIVAPPVKNPAAPPAPRLPVASAGSTALEPAAFVPVDGPSAEQHGDEQPSDEQPSDEQPSDEQPSDKQPNSQQPGDGVERGAADQPAYKLKFENGEVFGPVSETMLRQWIREGRTDELTLLLRLDNGADDANMNTGWQEIATGYPDWQTLRESHAAE